MIPLKYIFKPGAKPKPKVFDPNDPFVREVIEGVNTARDKLKQLNQYDPKQLQQVVNI